jgi:hypothetical protein
MGTSQRTEKLISYIKRSEEWDFIPSNKDISAIRLFYW